MNYPWLEKIEDPLVREIARKAMIGLELLSEGAAKPVGRRTPSSEPDHMPPEVQKRPWDGDGRPPRDRSLFERYYWWFEHGEERPDPQHHYAQLAIHAARDLRRHSKGAPDDAVAGGQWHLAEGQSRDGAALQLAKDREMVERTEGVPAAEVAMFEGVRIEVVWAARERSEPRRDRETGHPVSGWRGWTDEQRFQRVQSLKTRIDKRTGKRVTQEWVASELGTSRSAVQRYWMRMPQERAA